MKKIIISNNFLNKKKNILKESINNELTQFILDKVNSNQTSLSYCGMFPSDDGNGYIYSLLKNRFEEVKENLFRFEDINSTDEEYLYSYLSHLITRAQELEKPIENNLVKLCENIVIQLFNIPSETVNLSCKLVKKITPKEGAIRLLPENESGVDYDFSQLLSFENIKDLISKRRFINSLIQGGAYELGTIFELYDIDNQELVEIYKRIIAINDFILFTYKEKISDKTPKQGAYVEVMLGREGEKTEINSQGIIFPLLVIETIRGFLELFASHGLPKDNNLAREVIEHSDFLFAEPWDLRCGVGLWEKLTQNIDNTKLIPYYFTNICDLHNDDFKLIISNVLEDNLDGMTFIDDILNKSKEEFDYQKFMDVTQQKNSDIAVITDDIDKLDDFNDFLIKENYRQLSLPFDGSHWKYNYEYFLDYLYKIGKKGSLPPDKYTKKNGFDVSWVVDWEYDFDNVMYKMEGTSYDMLMLFCDYLEEYQNESIIDEYNMLYEKREIYSDVYAIVEQWDYSEPIDREEAIEALNKKFKSYHKNHLEHAIEMLDEYIESGDIEYPEISYDLENDLEYQKRILTIIDECQSDEYSTQSVYGQIIELLGDMGENENDFTETIGGEMTNNMQRLIRNYFQFDENGLLIIERGIKIEDLLTKPDELQNSTYHKTIDNYDDGIGNCWSWSEGYGQAYNSDKGETIVFKGKVNVNSVDWVSTIALYYEYNDEREIRLKPNSIVEVDEIILSTNGKHLPLDGSILVSSGNSYAINF